MFDSSMLGNVTYVTHLDDNAYKSLTMMLSLATALYLPSLGSQENYMRV